MGSFSSNGNVSTCLTVGDLRNAIEHVDDALPLGGGLDFAFHVGVMRNNHPPHDKYLAVVGTDNSGIALDDWCHGLDAVAVECGHEGSLVEQTGKEHWQDAFDEDFSPRDAYFEMYTS